MPQEQVRELYESLEVDATRLVFEDELTGVHNRRFLLSYLEREFAPVERGDEGAEPPLLGVVMVDIDRFKQVNDTYGHDAGDELIVWLATVLREEARESGIPVRWGGDEFMLLLPGADREATREVAERLWSRARGEPVEVSSAGTSLQLTLSIGVASAPEDAGTQEGLSRAADAALYHSKRTGRDRVSSAHEVDPEAIFPKAALYRLDASGIVARDEELELVATALDRIADGDGRIVVFEGETGSGKTTLLEKIGESVSRHDPFRVVSVSGSVEEERRPLYLAERIDRKLRQAFTGGEGPVDPCDEARPTDSGTGKRPPERIDEEILLLHAGSSPLVLLIDDLHLADVESLELLGRLASREETGFLLCGGAILSTDEETDEGAGADDAEPTGAGDEAGAPGDAAGPEPAGRTPLEEFLETLDDAVPVTRRTLAPLTAEEIEEYLAGAFPGLDTEERIGTVLEEITGGNPLFVAELTRMLVRDQKIRLVGQDWVVDPLSAEDLPGSLDEVVSRQIEALDDEDRRLLEQLSTLGENASLQALAGTSQVDEARLLDFLDRAEELGLLRFERERDDWNLRFLGKKVHEASYGAVEPERRRELHERVADYHQRRAVGEPSSSAPAAHHYRLAGDPEKAEAYEEFLRTRPDLAAPTADAGWSGGFEPAALRPGPPLDDDALEYVPNVLRGLIGSVRAIRLYPSGSRAITQARNEIGWGLDQILETTERLKLSRSEGFVLVNERRLATSECRALAGSYVELLSAAQLDSIAFDRGVDRDELQLLLEGLADLREESIDGDYWRRFLQDNDLTHIELGQQSYSRSGRAARGAPSSSDYPGAGEVPPGGRAANVEGHEQIPAVLRGLLGAVKSANLYPAGSDRMENAVAELEGALRGAVEVSPTLRIERIGDALSVNGVRLDATEFRALEDRFVTFLRDSDIDRITLTDALTVDDLHSFFDALREQANAGGDPEYWQDFTVEGELSGLAINDHRLHVDRRYRGADGHGTGEAGYAAPGSSYSRPRGAVQPGGPGPGPRTGYAARRGGSSGQAEGEPRGDESRADARGASSGEAATGIDPETGARLVAEGERRLFNELLGQVFSGFADQDAASRKRSARECIEVFDDLPLAEQYQVAADGSNALAEALTRESDREVLADLVPALRKCADVAIRFSDYRTADRLYGAMEERRSELRETDDDGDDLLDELLTAEPGPKLVQLLASEIRSRESERLPEVLGVLRKMGSAAVPLLVDVVQQEDDLHVRQLAADVLAEMNDDAARRLKRALNLASHPEQRVRILEIIDAVTDDVREELAQLLVDRSRSVRRAAFELAERLGRPELTGLLAPLMESDDPGIARDAARALGRLGSSDATAALIRRLRSTAETDLTISCCQALGELGDAGAVEALHDLLRTRRWGLFGRKWGSRVRAAAAKALRHIPGRRAAEVLRSFADDRDPAVRQIASRGPERSATDGERDDEPRRLRRRDRNSAAA